MPTPIDQKALKQLQDWTILDEKLHRVFILDNFVQAFGFMTQAAIVAEKMNHHPEWSNVYKTVRVDLTTHSEGCITQLDAELAAKMDDIFNKMNNKG
ncbi:MAG: 4a-hydroxytetrahydrobiopterin dehydratase [Candidatus Thioglobus sp.]|jgi:4a-hydroxytetrahydrobiopterin dehydratase|nr:MAG: 4a-hydroxytetrahydrobiopterin dehydratase [Candidatus Thioglobus sp.]RUM81343.1 MAG: 4a-hydroxytetrahydrobiopterin dehydratase [Candidatus Thioglobus sp.]RUM83344.1 MAG: 4a-hydroxytetrahydrobiopterin dehydratase [Candidatus Thioglobus sp.]RUM83369.1 MAG: 4a-hydroxytetrahydrobiopterin dehydratase [Candidatus Thioglobus sp.]